MISLLVSKPATPMPGTIKSQGTTLNIQLLASGKLSWKYVGSQDKRMKKQLFWQKWHTTHALKIQESKIWLYWICVRYNHLFYVPTFIDRFKTSWLLIIVREHSHSTYVDKYEGEGTKCKMSTLVNKPYLINCLQGGGL